ncbi:MAG: CsbD family protein [Gemmatimonadota bacterium]
MADGKRAEDTLSEKSVKDKVKGTVNELVGKGRGKLGDLTDNGSEHIKGKIQEVKGKIQKKKGDVEGKIADDLSVERDRKLVEDSDEDL